MEFIKKYPAVVLGAGITVIFLLLGILRLEFIDSLELKFYDVRMKFRTETDLPSDVVLVNIDDASVERLGHWPWPRSVIAEGLIKINSGRPRVIGLNTIFSEHEKNTGLDEIQHLSEVLSQIVGSKGEGDARKILDAMKEAQSRMDNDAKLARVLAETGTVVLPIVFKTSEVRSDVRETEGPLVDKALPPTAVMNPDLRPIPSASNALKPIPEFLKPAAGIGHVNFLPDHDGKVRKDLMLYDYRGLYIPSFKLQLAALYLGLTNADISVEIGSHVNLGTSQIPITRNSEFLIGYKGPADTFDHYSFYEVYNGQIGPEVFENKLVIISATASGVANPISTPAGVMTLGEFSANSIWAMLNNKVIRYPTWGFIALMIFILLVGALIAVVLPRLKALYAGLVFLGAIIFMVGLSTALFVTSGLWLPFMYPILQMVIGYIGIISINFFITETRKEKVEGESAETNRMLGLSFQSQGMLDMAYDKLRKVPVDDEMKEILYNLALDYERKRQFNKAADVYERIGRHDAKFKDVTERRQKLLHASETMVYGDGLLGPSSGGDPLMATTTGTRPTLGRYEIIRQLGKGAMGVVYLGQDPRINRTTAIKTFRFTDDFDEEDIKELKERFFREAESAGTLSHPNIVTIYDAGDEQELAYIAMEYLEGDDLQKYTKKGRLFPMRKVIDYVADIADALAYAHEKGIVHRDIKPANIMLLKTGIIKITDFGIARITATSQTQTGVVKGTPHYMSPEQISGKKVDGRSDIFSLGAMLYQLITGELPFRGNNPQALMHKIMNERHPDPRKFFPKIPKPLVTIIDKALEKDRNKRYQKASLMASHLRMLGNKIDAVMTQKKSGKKVN